MKTVFVIVSSILIASVSDVYAYLDPGTGSYALQIIIAGIVSVLFSLKMFWQRIVNFFTNLFKGKK